MIYIAIVIALAAWVYLKPLYPVTWFGRLWGRRVAWTAAMISQRYPSLHYGVQVRESSAWCNIIDFVTQKKKRGIQTIGCTLGRTIIIRPGNMAPWLIAHELEHVNQWEERGWYAVTADAEMEAEEAEAEFQKQ